MTSIRDPIALPLGFWTETVARVTNMGLVASQLEGDPMLTHSAPPSVEAHQTVLRDVV